MNFSKYKYLFLSISLAIILALLGTTYGYFGGFERSIAFNGGIRFSILMPAGQGRQELSQAAIKAGFKDPKTRQTDPRTNSFDLELGPDLRDKIDADLKEERQKKQKIIDQLRKEDKDIPAELMTRQSVADVVAEQLLPELGVTSDSIVSRETIAASYGSDLGWMAVKLLIYTLIAIGLYLTFRFDFPFALGASAALIHDILMTIGFIGVMQIQPSIPVLAAVLTIIGYSINDTIVIFDRIRVNVHERQQATLGATIDLAITQTLSRTVITSILTLLAALALFMGGESSLRDFAMVLIFGVFIGTYSSIFIASNAVQIYDSIRKKKRAA